MFNVCNVYFFIKNCFNLCGNHKTKEGDSPVANQDEKILVSNSIANLNEERGSILEHKISKINR